MLCGEFVNTIEIDNKQKNIEFSFFYLEKKREIMIEIIQHLHQNATITYIQVFLGHGVAQFSVFFVHTRTNLHMHAHAYTH